MRFGPYGPDQPMRVVVATSDPATLAKLSTWYLSSNLPRPGSPQAVDCVVPPADLTEVVRLYALRNWVEQSYKQVKGELGWADFQVRSDRAIRCHWHLVWCAFPFCWRAWFEHEDQDGTPTAEPISEPVQPGGAAAHPFRPLVAPGAPAGPKLAGSLDLPLALVARLVQSAPAA